LSPGAERGWTPLNKPTKILLLSDIKVVIHGHRAEISSLHAKMVHEQHRSEHLSAIIGEMDDRLHEAFKELKVSEF